MKRLLIGALLAGAAMTASNAADLAVKVPYLKAPAMMVYDWTGFYIGVNAGGGVGRDRFNNRLSVPGPTIAANDTNYLQPQGFVGGGQVGYNVQTSGSFLGLGLMVYGIEADIQGGDMRDNRTTLINNIGPSTTNYNQRLDWFGTVRGRVGITTGPVLGYVTGGYAYGNVRTDVNQNLLGPVTTIPLDGMRGGYVIGSGVEAALGGNWTGKIEYLYLNMSGKSYAFPSPAIPFVQQFATSEIRENIFRVGLNYRIGGNSSYVAPPAANWSGLYLGGNVASGVARNRTQLVTAGGLPETFNLSPDGYNGGVQAGYSWQASNWVFGVEADIQASSQRDNRSCVFTCAAFFTAAYNARLPWFVTARARIGYSVGSTLFYATGGYAYGGVKTDITTTNFSSPVTTALRSNKDGYAVGGGIETPFSFLGLFGPAWTTKTEYLYVDLGRTTDTVVASGLTFTNSTRVQEHLFRTGLNYHFHSPVVARY